jgi:Ca-activated chloride channel family protein
MIFRFASPWLLPLLVPALAAAWWLARRRSRGDARLALPNAGATPVGTSAWVRLDRVLPWMRGAAVVLGIVALARPQTGAREETVSTYGVDIVVALDNSGSMACEDERPLNRLEVARRKIGSFIERRPADRLGLVVFATLAATRAPLTLDHEMLQTFVREVDFAPRGEDQTALGMGLASAVNRLRRSSARSKVVILVTDGKSNAGQISPEAAASAAKALGIRVYTVGVGSDGEVVCPVDRGPLGRAYVTTEAELDEPLLRRIAESTGGRYFRATDTRGFEDAFETIDRLEKTEVQSKVRVLYSERFLLALLPASVLLGIEWLLSVTRLRRIP